MHIADGAEDGTRSAKIVVGSERTVPAPSHDGKKRECPGSTRHAAAQPGTRCILKKLIERDEWLARHCAFLPPLSLSRRLSLCWSRSALLRTLHAAFEWNLLITTSIVLALLMCPRPHQRFDSVPCRANAVVSCIRVVGDVVVMQPRGHRRDAGRSWHHSDVRHWRESRHGSSRRSL